jgi:hypothetical protein
MNSIAEDRPRLKGGATIADPLAVGIAEAVRLSALSRSAIYRELAAGNLRAVKHGTKTLILMDSLRAHLASLPPATFRTA